MIQIAKKIILSTRNMILWFFLKKKLVKHITQDGYYFICPYGIGDTYLLCSLINHFRKLNRNKSITIFVESSHKSIPKMFGIKKVIEVEKIYISKSDKLLLRLFNLNKKVAIKKNTLHIAHPIHLLSNKRLSQIGSENFLFAELYKEMLGLPAELNFTPPNKMKRSYIINNKNSLIKKINKQTVLLIPDAKSINNMPKKFWLFLSEELKRRGYRVLFNYKCETNDYESIYPPLEYFIPISKEVAGIVSIRNGLCDLLSSTNNKLIILYPDKKWFRGTIYEGSSINKIFKKKHLELIYKKESEKELINKILLYLHENNNNNSLF